jgi:hypothetical protein
MGNSLYLSVVPALPEGFRAVEGFDFYCVNADGSVLSCRTRGGKFIPWKAMTPHLDKEKHGRLFVSFRKGGKLHPKSIHRLVLETFRGPCPEGLEACHNDGNPLNNNLNNLRWDTHSSNMADRDKHGRTLIGVRNPSARLTEGSVREIRKLYREGMQQKDIAPIYGVSKQCVQTVCSRTNWTSVI